MVDSFFDFTSTVQKSDGLKIGLHSLVHDCVQGCAVDLRTKLARSVVLAGGNSMIRGLEAEL